MAGGMNKRGSWGSLEDRLAAGRESDAQRDTEPTRTPLHGAPFPGQRRPSGPDPMAPTHPLSAHDPEPPAALRHCWVTDRHGRLPGLLLEWRKIDDHADWEGRVVHAVQVEEPGGTLAWDLVEEWLPMGLLEQA